MENHKTSVGENDSGTSSRMLGTILTWMSENKEKVFYSSYCK